MAPSSVFSEGVQREGAENMSRSLRAHSLKPIFFRTRPILPPPWKILSPPLYKYNCCSGVQKEQLKGIVLLLNYGHFLLGLMRI